MPLEDASNANSIKMKQSPLLPSGLVLAGLIAASVSATAKTEPKAAAIKPLGERFATLAAAEDPSFRRHVLPLFSRTGCSGRECHGAFSGQGGYSLSLFGYDFEKDHKETTADTEEGVRIDPKNPANSLVLLKPTMQEKHKGKERIKKDSWEYNLVLKWIQSGAKNDAKETGTFAHLEVLPKEIVFRQPGEVVQLRVIAHWADGTVEDVTQITRFRTNDESVADVSDTGVVSSKSKGDTHVVAFYDNGVHPIPVMLPVSDNVGSKYPKVATPTKVDELVVNKLRKAGIVPSGVCTDTEFLRRVSLDVTGTLPTPKEIREFLDNPSPNKRVAKVEELLKRPSYAAWWATKLSDFTGNNAGQINERQYSREMSRQWYDWIEHRVANNTPYDQMVAGIVLAKSREPGQSYLDYATEMSSYIKKKNPANFAERSSMPHYWNRRNAKKSEEKALSFSHAFLGVQIQCAQCHKHPFDQWTKQDFEQFQAFFDGINYGNRRDGSEEVTYASLTKEINEAAGYDRKDQKSKSRVQQEINKRVAAGQPVPWQELYINEPRQPNPKSKNTKTRKNVGSSRVLTPKVLGGDEVHLTEYPDPRAPLMEWMRDEKNPYFARAFVNRVWANYFGRGIVEPADDMNLANPPTNAELMDYLATGFVKSGYDMKWLHQTIVTSDTYQRSWVANETNELDEKNFSRMVLRRLPAEVVTDAIDMATAATDRLEQFPNEVESRAIGPMIIGYRGGGNRGNSNYALELFGKPIRLTNCDCERLSNPTLLQTLYTRNDPEIHAKIENSSKGGQSWIAELRKEAQPARGKGGASLESLREQLDAAQKKLARFESGPDSTKTSKGAKQLREKLELGVQRLRAQIEQATAALKPAPAASGPATDKLIEEAFLRTVSRPPSAAELAQARQDVAAAGNPLDGLRDLLWAMLNTKEFIVNH